MITKEEYQARRQKLADHLPSNSLAVIPAGKEVLRNGDAHYRFRQSSDFYYLTGFQEPDGLLLVTSGPESKSILFNQPRDPEKEQWTGKRLGQEAAPEVLGVDIAYCMDELDRYFPEYLANQYAVYFSVGCCAEWEARLLKTWRKVAGKIRQGIHAPEALFDLSPILSEMRLFKSPAELDLMRKAADFSVAAHRRAMQACRHLTNESQLEAEWLYELTRQGCRNTAYDPIVASGENACILHYTKNDAMLSQGDLILIDAGGEFENYAADITRTFPSSGRFSDAQREIYRLVLQAQRAGMARIRPGCPWHEIQSAIVSVLTTGLVELGILHGRVDELIANQAYRPFYMHQSGHWLGLDVHDVGQYKVDSRWRPLASGMVLTVEPGIYIHPKTPDIDARWLGIGIRIEDDIHVTNDGFENFSAALAVELDDVEATVRGN